MYEYHIVFVKCMSTAIYNELNGIFDCCQVAVQGLGALKNITVNADNKIALRPHIGVIVNLLQEHSSDSKVL